MIKRIAIALALIGFLVTSCNKDEDDVVDTERTLTLNLSGLESLGDDFVYEGWIIVNDKPISTGKFSSITFPQSFPVNASQLTNATTFVLSIEPAADSDPSPSATKVLKGNFAGNSANLNSESIVADFSTISGKYILATPTDTETTNEYSGVWFLDNSTGSAVAGLELPPLSDGWNYEGWVVIDGKPLSTGTFKEPNMADDNAVTSTFKGSTGNGPAFPGEDYLQNAPLGLTFPTDLRGKTIVISVEPSPDNSALPFTLKPLLHMVPSDAKNNTAIPMGTGPVSSLTGVVFR